MKAIITDLYKILYKYSRAKNFSAYGAIAYVTVLNLITVQGLGQLLEGWLSMMRYLRLLFIFPYVIGPALLVFFIHLKSMMPFKNLKKERQKPPYLMPIIVYSLACVLILLYVKFGANLFK